MTTTRDEILSRLSYEIPAASPLSDESLTAADLWRLGFAYDEAAGLCDPGQRTPILRRANLAFALALAAEGKDASAELAKAL